MARNAGYIIGGNLTKTEEMNILHCINKITILSAKAHCSIIVNDIHICFCSEKYEDILYLNDFIPVRFEDAYNPNYTIYMASLSLDMKQKLADLIEKKSDCTIRNHVTDSHYCHTHAIGSLLIKVYYRKECSYFIIHYENVFYILYDVAYINKKSLALYVVRELIYRESENRDCICFHAASCRIKQNGVVLIGDSGAGKTSLLVALMEKFKGDFISNDRALISADLDIFPLPMPVRISPGTIISNDRLHNFIVSNAPQLCRFSAEQIKEINQRNFKNSPKKLELSPKEISECFSVKRLASAKLKMIIIPKYDPHNCGMLMETIDFKSAKDFLLRNCFTPNDPLWITPWFGRRSINFTDVLNIIDGIIQKIPVYRIVFGPDVYLNREIEPSIMNMLSC